MDGEQLPLFSEEGQKGEYTRPLSESPPLTASSSLSAAIGGFHEHMIREGFTENTIKSFRSDLRLLKRHVGAGTALSEIGTRELEQFLTWLLHYRGVPCSPKSYSRRVTTLKVFFGWLAEAGVLRNDPAAPIVHKPASTPLPDILYDDQVERLLEATRAMMEDPHDPDVRPHLLLTLLLKTGIKKGECVSIALDHIDLSDPKKPVLYVRYDNPRMQKKERKLALPSDFPTLFAVYEEQYQPKEQLFECTARNLEYILDDVAKAADISGGISFEMLRWTSAVRDHRDGMPPDRLRKKLGLSPITWRETSQKIEKLAAPAL